MEQEQRQKMRTTHADRVLDALIRRMENGEPFVESPNPFQQSAEDVAVMLQGAAIAIGERTITVLQARPFDPEKNIRQRKTFSEAIAADIGTLTGVSYRGKSILPNITVAGGLVMPTAISYQQDDAEIILTRPTDIACVFGLEANESGSLIQEDPDVLAFTFVKSDPAIPQP